MALGGSPLAVLPQAACGESAAAEITGRLTVETSMIGALPDPVIMVDEEDRIVYANAATESLLGWTPTELQGRPLILAFYPADWSPVCGDQMTLYNEMLGEFQEFDAELLGISVDGAWCHAAFARDRKLHFPLLADFEPKGAVARHYGVYREKDGVCERALFVVDPEGIIRWSYVSPLGVNPGANGILTALEQLKSEKAEATR